MSGLNTLLRLMADAPETQIDKNITLQLYNLIGKQPGFTADALERLINECTHSSLASDCAMVSLDAALQMAKKEARK